MYLTLCRVPSLPISISSRASSSTTAKAHHLDPLSDAGCAEHIHSNNNIRSYLSTSPNENEPFSKRSKTLHGSTTSSRAAPRRRSDGDFSLLPGKTQVCGRFPDKDNILNTLTVTHGKDKPRLSALRLPEISRFKHLTCQDSREWPGFTERPPWLSAEQRVPTIPREHVAARIPGYSSDVTFPELPAETKTGTLVLVNSPRSGKDRSRSRSFPCSPPVLQRPSPTKLGQSRARCPVIVQV